ncbi:oxidoreductase [Aspergillus heteromorphus CBS 117.55]|uniref:Oxidoreductase n=1 Tax=Aspergillus heteromorphus CBS 117.55 TaxID=1448321 RepID=A0A317WI68_9EURO|nr:oxidoreductase [Aspergillus heteromorphus CBS 117.55]PWY84972.1 oxidoreductase [Aspergillus heteromorphus CBS 117.55]
MTSPLPPSADYIIVGGGTAGLVVANRLSSDPSVRVLVLEAGPDRTSDPQIQNPNAWQSLPGSDADWKMKTVPQAGLNNRTQDHPAGKLLGGSSSLNGLVYVAPSPAGINAWAELGNTDWTWERFAPYLRKSVTVSAPEKEVCETVGVQVGGGGGDGPIQVTFPALQERGNDPLLRAWVEGFKGLGVGFTGDVLEEGKMVGTRAHAASIDPVEGLRSSACGQHGAEAGRRENVTVVTGVMVRRVFFSTVGEDVVATGVEVGLGVGGEATVTADKEVILAAGAFHTPKLLELSGVGDRKLLSGLGIPVVVENSGVGENLQNHLMGVLVSQMNKIPEMEGVTPGIQALAFLRLDGQEQADLAARYLTHEQGVEKVIRGILKSPNEATAFLLLGMLPGDMSIIVMIPCFPASRGNIHITSTDFATESKFDPRFFSHPLDIELMARHYQKLQQVPLLPELQPFFQPLAAPADLESTKEALRTAAAQSAHHTCGTAAMLPREAGGVVDQELRVYGTRNLRVVDASVFPLMPHGNPMSVVYAVAERAADLIQTGK